MYYHYTIGGKHTQCFFNDYVAGDMTVFGTMITYDDNGESGEYKVLKDNNGNRYFVVDGEQIMFDDYHCYTPSELIANIKNIRDYNLCQTLMKYGIDSVRLMRNVLDFDHRASMKKHDAKYQLENGQWIEYKFVEGEYLSEPKDNYKLKLTPANEVDREDYPDWRTYVCDMVSLFAHRPDLYQLKVNEESEVPVNA